MAGSIVSKLHRLALGLGLLAGLGLVAPEIAFADRPSAGECKRKKSKKRKKARRARRARRAKAFNARTVKKLQRRGYTNDEIVKKARAANFVVTKKQQRRMKKMRVRRSLIAALAAPAPAKVAAVPAKPEPIDINRTIDPNDIDFDSVPPPDGMPTQYATKPKAPEKKKLDTSLRPSAPFEANKPASSAKKPVRKVLTAAN